MHQPGQRFMQTEDFLTKIIPAQGLKCIAVALPAGGFRHYWNHTHADAALAAETLNNKGENVYFALASYQTTESRKGDNARLVQSFWLDIDCGPTKPYPSQLEGSKALSLFIRETGLPDPMVVSSGNGLHVYWPLTTPLTAAQWRVLSHQLKQLTDLQGLQADPNRTADVASVLRPPGTRNPKGGRPVELLLDADPVDPAVFETLLHDAIGSFGELPGQPPKPRAPLNADLTGGQDFPPASAYQIAERCAQIAHIRDTLGNVNEPLWYAGIGLLRFTVEGDELVQAWSSGHPDYSEEATAAKIAQHIESGAKPTTCSGFQKANPAACVACPHAGKVHSPISLGFPEPKPLDEPPRAADGEALPPVPRGYQRTDKGISVLVQDAEGDQSWQVFCPYDLYPVARLRIAGNELLRVRVKFPLEGWQEFDLDMGVVVSSPKDLTKALGEKGVALKPWGAKHMPGYLIDWITQLQQEKEAIPVYEEMGWQDDGSFVCGERRYMPDGRVMPVVLGKKALSADLDKKFTMKGDIEEWKEAAAAYDYVGMEQYQFLVGAAFGAPLMRFTQQEAAVIHVMSESSGQGKTTAEGAALSVFGHPHFSRMGGRDTENAVFSRLGSYRSLLAVVDEVDAGETIHKQWDPRPFVHTVSQGKERSRLKQDGTERNPGTYWRTLVAISTNRSIAERLAANKPNPEAEIARIIEYTVKMPEGFYTKEEAEAIFGKFNENYGLAGDIYLKWLVQHPDQAARMTARYQSHFDRVVKMTTTERYWSAAVGCILAGLFIASRLGLVQYDLVRLERWAAERINDMRGLVYDSVRTPLESFASFLNENVNHILVVDRSADMRKNQGCQVLNTNVVRGPLKARIERNINRLFVSKACLSRELNQRGVNITGVRNFLQEIGALTRVNVLKSLGHGTEYATIHTPCWEVDLTAKELSGLADLTVVTDSTDRQLAQEGGE